MTALVYRLRIYWRSESACAMCGKPERPWRRMMVYPFTSVFAYVCSDACWDRLAEKSRG